MIEEHYAILKKEYNLPLLKEVETNLDYVTHDLPVIRQLLLFMLDEVQNIAGHVLNVLSPNHFVHEVEFGFYHENDKKKLGKKHAELVSFAHEIIAGLYSGEKEQAEIFKTAYERFILLKKFGKEMASFHAKKWLEAHKEEEKESRHFG